MTLTNEQGRACFRAMQCAYAASDLLDSHKGRERLLVEVDVNRILFAKDNLREALSLLDFVEG